MTQLEDPSSSFKDMNAFIEQSKAEHNVLLTRVEVIETTRRGEEFSTNTKTGTLQHVEVDVDESDVDETKSPHLNRNKSIIRRKTKPWKYQKFPLPESTYTLLITERVLSMPFVVGMITVAGSLMCLGITLMNELDNEEDGNKYGLPAGVPKAVRIAQFLGIIIGEYHLIFLSCFNALSATCLLLTISPLLTLCFYRRAYGRGGTLGT